LLLAVIAPLALIACATTQSPEAGEPSPRDSADVGYGMVARDYLTPSSNTIRGEEPHFVLDGMVVRFDGRDINGLDPRTIESITVLKNAGDTAIYGSRGANGVILIKTKRGPPEGG
jgi:TonB-dependent SusC/RagA subfamily outer membrane receptor